MAAATAAVGHARVLRATGSGRPVGASSACPMAPSLQAACAARCRRRHTHQAASDDSDASTGSQAEGSSGARRSTLPIFPLNVVALPSATVPLMIFEARCGMSIHAAYACDTQPCSGHTATRTAMPMPCSYHASMPRPCSHHTAMPRPCSHPHSYVEAMQPPHSRPTAMHPSRSMVSAC
eukprot:366545-Chlamydomonas_euryale.AAC.12